MFYRENHLALVMLSHCEKLLSFTSRLRNKTTRQKSDDPIVYLQGTSILAEHNGRSLPSAVGQGVLATRAFGSEAVKQHRFRYF